jgi:hypothetical protein
VRAGAGAYALAVSGGVLYVATDFAGAPPYALSAYDLRSGRLIRRVGVPAMPAALRVGPGSNVWLTFYADQAGGPTATWLFSRRLAARSVATGTAPTALDPVGRDSALYATQDGLDLLDMPKPGQPGRFTVRHEPGTSLGARSDTAPGYTAVTVDNRVVVQVTNGEGDYGHLVIAGKPRETFGGTARTDVGYAATVGDDLWVTTSGSSGASGGPLVELRLGDRFRAVTPHSISSNPALGQSEQVWSTGPTVWVATSSPGHWLVCFSGRGPVGPLARIPVTSQPVALTASTSTVYVATSTGTALASSNVLGYPVPASCR